LPGTRYESLDGVDERTLALDRSCTFQQATTCYEAGKRYLQMKQPSAFAKQRMAAVLYRACRQQKHAEACVRLGEAYRSGALPLPPARAPLVPLFRHMCETATPLDGAACLAAGLFATGCDAGSGQGCEAYAQLLWSGRVPVRNARQRALHLQEQACRNEHGPSCDRLGERYERGGEGLVEDGASAVRWYRRGCQLQQQHSCVALGRMYRRGRGVRIDLAKAAGFYRRACQAGSAAACTRLGKLVARGRAERAAPDLAAAAALFDRACSLDDAEGCHQHGLALELGRGLEADPVAAYEVFNKTARMRRAICGGGGLARDLDACVGLGAQLRTGRGVPRDRSAGLALQKRACREGRASGCLAWMTRGKALVLLPTIDFDPIAVLERSCSGAEPEACFTLARLPNSALATSRLADQRRVLLDRACGAGHGPSCNALGASNPRWDAAAHRSFSRACALGDAAGCFHVALLFELPGAPRRADRGAQQYQRSCAWGMAQGCRRLGLLHAQGEGVDLEPRLARRELSRACKRGVNRACFELAVSLLDMPLGPGDRANGLTMLQRGCRKGTQQACTQLGQRKLAGTNGAKDVAGGVALLKAACKQHEAEACVVLAERIRGEDDAAQVRAKQLLSQAVSSAQPSCSALVSLCKMGRPLRPSEQLPAPGVKWESVDGVPSLVLSATLPSCNGDWLRSCRNAARAQVARCALGERSCNQGATLIEKLISQGLPFDAKQASAMRATAVEHAEQDCRAKDAFACQRAAKAYAEGRGVRTSPVRSRRLQARACRLDKSLCR